MRSCFGQPTPYSPDQDISSGCHPGSVPESCCKYDCSCFPHSASNALGFVTWSLTCLSTVDWTSNHWAMSSHCSSHQTWSAFLIQVLGSFHQGCCFPCLGVDSASGFPLLAEEPPSCCSQTLTGVYRDSRAPCSRKVAWIGSAPYGSPGMSQEVLYQQVKDSEQDVIPFHGWKAHDVEVQGTMSESFNHSVLSFLPLCPAVLDIAPCPKGPGSWTIYIQTPLYFLA